MKNNEKLQDIFLNEVRKNKSQITIFLVSGFQLKGYVTGFDAYTVMIDSDGKQQMIYKHAISTIVPSKPVRMVPDDVLEAMEVAEKIHEAL